MNYKVRNIGVLILIIDFISYSLTALINPGLPNNNLLIINNNNLENNKICDICKIIMRKEDKIEHCNYCNVCIIGILYLYLFLFLGLDHHCQWISKCVGRNNIKYFYFFVFTSIILLLYLFFGLFYLDN